MGEYAVETCPWQREASSLFGKILFRRLLGGGFFQNSKSEDEKEINFSVCKVKGSLLEQTDCCLNLKGF